MLPFITWKTFFEYLFTSVNRGKIKSDKKCLFCGSELDNERLSATQARIGRLRFLLRSVEEGSKIADDLLNDILITPVERGGHDLPEREEAWWDDKVREIYSEKRRIP